MLRGRVRRLLAAAALVTLPAGLLAQLQFDQPHIDVTSDDVKTVLGTTILVNHGLVGMGRLSASRLDPFNETFGSVSGLQITGWTRRADGTYRGTLNILPDRGYNNGSFFSDYAARINKIDFKFTPFTGSSIGGATLVEQIAAQSQIQFTSGVTGVQFSYDDPVSGITSVTTGLDPGTSFTTNLFGGKPMPYVTNYLGLAAPGPSNCAAAIPPADCQVFAVNKLPIDAEALVLKTDGSGYLGDEYGAHIYYFNPSKKIIGAIVPPDALEPHAPVTIPNFNSVAAPVNGRRNNQGLEGVALSPDGTHLFAVLQSGTVQDASSNQSTRKQTWVLVYDVATDPTPSTPVAEYALTLPIFRVNPATSTALDRTAAQSEILALDNYRLLILSRDGNGLGHIDANPSMFKSILLVDTRLGNPTNLAPLLDRNKEGGKLTTTAGNLDPLITPVVSSEVVNILNTTLLGRFHMELDRSGLTATPYQVSKLTLGEKWEGLSLVPAKDPSHPNDYFLFVGNDNDFLTSAGQIVGPAGMVRYNGFNGYSPTRIPAPVGSENNENDTLILAYRVTIIADASQPLDDASVPDVAAVVTETLGNNNWYTSHVSVSWTVADGESGIAALSNCGRTTHSDTPGVTLTCSATNGAGLTGESSITLKVDRKPPRITPPPDKIVSQDRADGAVVTYHDPHVVETGSGIATLFCLPASNTVFPIGTTHVECTATDMAGNSGSAAFKVTVKPAPNGRMFGNGHIEDHGTRYHFIFRVAQLHYDDYGRLEFWSDEPRRCSRADDDRYRDRNFNGSRDDHYGKGHRFDIDKFEATSVERVTFADDPAFKPNSSHHPAVDTATFEGKGRWNGRSGYSFVATATASVDTQIQQLVDTAKPAIN